ncbi:MAG: glycosyltransferase family 39 protein [Chloroflexi bacterium]|nr:glycosyltransferase family 39 protein [Chloroflexota bacterium]
MATTLAPPPPAADATPTMHAAPHPHSRLALGALALVLVLALGVRLWGLDWQLPWQFHPDEGHYTWKALDMMSQGSLNPKYFRNPSFFTYVLLGEYNLLGFRPPKEDEQAATRDGLWEPPSGVAFVGRLNGALMGVGTVAAVGLIGWRLLGPWAGVLAGLFLSLAFIHVRDSHYATNDVPAAFLLTLSVAASLAIVERPRLRAYLLAGLFGGLATSTKYNAGLFVVPLLLAHGAALLRHHRTAANTASIAALLRALVVPLALAGLVSLLAYLAGTPYTLLDAQKFLADFRTQSSFVDEGWEGQILLPPGVPYVLALGEGVGWVMPGLALVGLASLGRRQPLATLVLVGYPVAYVSFMLRSELFFVRFALPVVPFLCVLAAAAVVLIATRVSAARRNPLVGVAVGMTLVVAALVQPTLAVIRHNLIVGQDDTRILAARWALENVPPGAKAAVEEYTLRDRRPRAYGGPVWQIDTDALDVNKLRRADPTGPLRGSTRFFVTSSFQQDRFGLGLDTPQHTFYEALASECHLRETFAPGRGNQPLAFELEDLYTPFWDLDRYERPGPTIRIYDCAR